MLAEYKEENFFNPDLKEQIERYPNLSKYCFLLSKYKRKKLKNSKISLCIDPTGLSIESDSKFIYLKTVNNFLEIAKFICE